MVNEQTPTGVQSVDQQAIGGPNLSDIVNKEVPKTDNAVPTNAHKSIFDTFIGLIAKLSGNPDPFTGKGGTTATPKPEFQASTQTSIPEIKTENQTTTAPAKTEEGGLFGKFSSTLTNLGNVVGNLGEKALGSATNVVNKGLETANKVGEQAVNQAQKVATETTGNITSTLKDFKNLDGQNNVSTTTNTGEQPISPNYFFPQNNNTTEQKPAEGSVNPQQ